MFTGLIESVGHVAEVKSTGAGMRLRVRSALATDLAPGDSLAVNGVCLTVILAEDGEVHADVGPETARVTTIGSLQRDEAVNLECDMVGKYVARAAEVASAKAAALQAKM